MSLVLLGLIYHLPASPPVPRELGREAPVQPLGLLGRGWAGLTDSLALPKSADGPGPGKPALRRLSADGGA